MKKREAQFTILFRHYLKAHPMFSAVFELKQTTTNSIAFSSVKEHQLDALKAAKSSVGFLYKISDDSIGIKPFDLVYYRNAPAYIVIRYPTHFSFIDIDVFIEERDTSPRKSLESERARVIAWKTVDL